MQSASLNYLLWAGLVSAIAGCYSPYGYQSPYAPGGYGQPMQPGYPGNPVYTVPQGQPYAPGGTIAPGTVSPTPITPPTYDNGGTSGKNDAPPFDANNPPAGNSGNRTVPLPADDLNGPAASNPGGLQPTSSQRDNLQSPFQQESNNFGSPAQPANVGTQEDPFEMPDRVSSAAEIPAVIQSVNFESPAERLNPYGRDVKHANPEWLRGVVDYDPQQRTWQITYADQPDPRDPNGGSLTLGKHAALTRCRSGDIVLVEGAIDASQVDRRGKPLYVLDKVTPLTTE